MISAMKVTAIQSDWVGRVIDGRFTLLQWLGRSGRSSVFLAELPGEPPQKATLKLMPADADVEARIAFAANASRAHACLARVLQSGRCEIDGAPFAFVVTEFADEVLSEILPMRPLAPEEVKEMLVPILDALTDLHGHGLVHGRLRPSNILVVSDELKLSADSLQLAGASADETAALSIYDAPERVEGTLSPASDVWSLGVTIVEALTQRTPDWNRSTNRDAHIPESIPQPFAAVVAACLRVDPARRATLNDIKGRLGLARPAEARPLAEARPTAATPVAAAAPPTPKPAAKTEPKPVAQAQQKPAGQAQRQQKPVAKIEPAPAVQAELHPASRALPRFAFEKPESRRKSRRGVLLVLGLILVAVVVLLWSRSHGTLPATTSNDQPPAPTSAPAAAAPQTPPHAPPPTQATPEPEQQLPPPANAPSAAAAAAPGQSSASAVKGTVAQRVMPNPLPAASRTIHGKVNVRVRVNVSPTGEVTDAGFEPAGPSKYFAEVAMRAARQWKFTPAQANGQPIASVWMLHFVFTRENIDVTPVQTSP